MPKDEIIAVCQQNSDDIWELWNFDGNAFQALMMQICSALYDCCS